MRVKKWIQHIVMLMVGLFLTAGFSGYSRVWAADSAASDTITVTIEQAEKTEYLKDADSGEEVIRFTGNVVLTVDNRDSKIGIQAETITFNRARATIYASGNVTFEQSGGGRNTEKLTAGTLLFNTRTLEGVFDDGRVVQEHSGNINLPTGSVLVVFADSFGRENGGTVTFRNGTLTFCDAPEPHWKINASRIWLLPGNEFAIFSGLMYVGNFPVLYIPFFYYPKEEMIVNPSFGFDSRKGYYTMTTTYLIGRKGLEKDSSSSDDDRGFDFMKTTSLKEQVREGLFMHNLDADATMPDNSLKILADMYSNLGYMAGIEGDFKPKKYFTSVSFGAYAGMSKILFPVESTYGGYTTWSPSNVQYQDSGWLLGDETSFRFGAYFKTAFNLKPITFTISMPLYSDPYFTSDFLSDRKESMDWISFLMENVTSSEDSDTTATANTLSSYTWSFTGSVSTPEVLSPLKPFIQDFSLSSVSSQVNFLTKANAELSEETKEYDPNRYFYYPSMVQPLKASVRISGKVFSFDSSSSESVTPEIGNLEMPEEIGKWGTEQDDHAEENGADVPDDSQSKDLVLVAPANLSTVKPTSVSVQGFTVDLSYSILPSVVTEINYDSASFTSPESIDWDDIKNRYLQLKCPVTVQGSAGWRGGFVSLSSSLEFQPVYQEHSDFADSFYDTKDGQTQLKTIMESDYKARVLNLNDTTSLALKPFQYVNWLSGSSVSWNMGVKLIRTEFTGTADEPSWDYLKAEWDKDSISSHNVTGVMAMTQQNNRFSEKATLKVNLPPLDERYETSVSVSFPGCTSFAVSTAWKKNADTDDDDEDEEEWIKEPLNQSSSWSFFGSKLSVSESYRYNREDERNESFSFSASGFGGSVSYSMLYTVPYEYVEGTGWVAQKEKEFLPYSLNMKYALPSTNWYYVQNRISLKPVYSSSLAMNLIRPTLSSLTVNGGLTFNINEFLTLTVSGESQNKVVYRYIQKYTDNSVTIPGEESMLKDLWNSVSLWDNAALRNSGFKLRSISVSLDHNLHDWTLHSEFKVSPRTITEDGVSRYDYAPYFVLSVKWNPMSSLKTTIEDKYGEFILNPAKD